MCNITSVPFPVICSVWLRLRTNQLGKVPIALTTKAWKLYDVSSY